MQHARKAKRQDESLSLPSAYAEKSGLRDATYIGSAVKRERGIALVITLGLLAVILLIAVAFALTARTEQKSGSYYGVLIASKLMARAGLDRCLMEMAYQTNQDFVPYSGGNTSAYTSNDLTQIDGSYLNDTNGILGAPGDFIDINNDATRETTEPYWIKVTNSAGKIIGRFAYTIVHDVTAGTNQASGLIDINAIGNIFSNNDVYTRLGGYLGVAQSNYTLGTCSDVSLIGFLGRLGFSDPTNAAWRILAYRYGWTGGTTNPAVNVYKPGTTGDDNQDGILNDPTEYAFQPPRGINRAISPLSLVWTIPIVSDPANTNLANYATISSVDPNMVNACGLPRINLNATRTGNAGDVSNLVSFLRNVFPTNDLNQLTQWAVNLIDFHTTNVWPTVYTGGVGGTNTFYGIKRTPHLNQILITMAISVSTSGSNAWLSINVDSGAEVWNPYPYDWINSTAQGNLGVTVTNLTTITFPPTIGANPSAITYDLVKINAPVSAGTIKDQHHSHSWTSSTFPTNYLPGYATISNRVIYSYTHQTDFTKQVCAGWFDCPPTNIYLYKGMSAQNYYMNFEADDPRMNVLFSELQGANVGSSDNYGLGWTNTYTFADQGGPDGTNREGLASFYVKMSDYTSIAEIGYVHRGEQWKTIRLQPVGEGRLLDFIRVNDLTNILGRVNINCDTNGVGGAPLQSPALYALFDGLRVTNAAAGATQFISFDKITNVIANLGAYRSSLPGGGFTNIGQLCELQSFLTDVNGSLIPATDDADREAIIRGVANLVTYSPSSATEIVAWGQAVRGNRPQGMIQIHAWYQVVGNRITLTKFEYVQ